MTFGKFIHPGDCHQNKDTEHLHHPTKVSGAPSREPLPLLLVSVSNRPAFGHCRWDLSFQKYQIKRMPRCLDYCRFILSLFFFKNVLLIPGFRLYSNKILESVIQLLPKKVYRDLDGNCIKYIEQLLSSCPVFWFMHTVLGYSCQGEVLKYMLINLLLSISYF